MIKELVIKGRDEEYILKIPDGLSSDGAADLIALFFTITHGKITPSMIANLLRERMESVWELIGSEARSAGCLSEGLVAKIIRRILFDMKVLPDRNSSDLFTRGFFLAIDQLSVKMADALGGRCKNPEGQCFLEGKCPGDCFPF
jgi:hypothetical protein